MIGTSDRVRPHLKLFNRRRAKRIRRAQQHRPALPAIIRRQLAGGSGLARAVYAHHHHHFGGTPATTSSRRNLIQHLLQLDLQQPLQFLAALDPMPQPALPQVLNDRLRRRPADIRRQQHRLQLRQRGLVDLARQRQHRPNRLGERVARPRHRLPHAVEETTLLRRAGSIPRASKSFSSSVVSESGLRLPNRENAILP